MKIEFCFLFENLFFNSKFNSVKVNPFPTRGKGKDKKFIEILIIYLCQ